MSLDPGCGLHVAQSNVTVSRTLDENTEAKVLVLADGDGTASASCSIAGCCCCCDTRRTTIWAAFTAGTKHVACSQNSIRRLNYTARAVCLHFALHMSSIAVARNTKITARRAWFLCCFAVTVLATCQNHWGSGTCRIYNLGTQKPVSRVLILSGHEMFSKILATNTTSRRSGSVYRTQKFYVFGDGMRLSHVIILLFYYAVVYPYKWNDIVICVHDVVHHCHIKWVLNVREEQKLQLSKLWHASKFHWLCAPPLIGRGIKRCFCMTSVVCLTSVCRVHRAYVENREA